MNRHRAMNFAIGPSRPGQSLRTGFTLIEIVAVVLIIGFISAAILPGLPFSGGARRHDEALNVASHLELARQRAIMTSKIHRVLIDVDNSSYRVEWFVRQSGSDEFDNIADQQRAVWEGNLDSVLRPPGGEFSYQPIPSKFGNTSVLGDPFYFDGVETSDGWLDEGLVAVVFDRDGTTDKAQIVITDPDGFAATLDILPILDSVRIRHEDNSD